MELSKAFLVSQTEDHVKISFVFGSTLAKCKDFSGYYETLVFDQEGMFFCSSCKVFKFSLVAS